MNWLLQVRYAAIAFLLLALPARAEDKPPITIGFSIEQTGGLASFGRSQQIVRGNGWNVFGTLVLLWLIYIVASFVIGLILSALPVAWRNGLGDVISGTIIAPFIAVAVTLMYYRLTGAVGGRQGTGPGDSAGTGGYGAA